MNATPAGVEQVQIRWSDGWGWNYRHLDQHGGVIGASTDADAKLTCPRFATPADVQSIIHEAAQIWPNARIVDVSTNQS